MNFRALISYFFKKISCLTSLGMNIIAGSLEAAYWLLSLGLNILGNGQEEPFALLC